MSDEDEKATLAMGVFLNIKNIRKLKDQIAHYRVERLSKANKIAKVNLFFFSIKQLDIVDKKISGIYWDEARQLWIEKEFDYPDVLYIRGGAGKKNRMLFHDFISELKDRNCILLNYPRFNKLEIYRRLIKCDLIKDHLPPTKEYEKPKDLFQMLKEYKSLYLKAFIGRKGRQVLRLDLDSNNGYKLSYSKVSKAGEEELIQKSIKTQTRLLKEIDMFFKGKKFLMQKAINLMELNDRKIDMRAEAQRIKDGNIEILGVCVRMGNRRAPITTHSEAYRFNDFFEEVLNYPKEKLDALEKRINAFLLKAYSAIEDGFGPYAEIGIDFAVDKEGEIWFIECNSQSAKVSLEKAYPKDLYDQSFLNLLEYSKYARKKRDSTAINNKG